MHQALQLQGKREGQPVVAATTGCPPQPQGRRLLALDKTTKHYFLLDSGSDLCCYPRRLLRGRYHPTGYDLSAANESTIKTYGSLTLTLDLGLRRSFTWIFTIADVASPIIGSDFLGHYNLLPDCHHKRLIDGVTGLTVACRIASVTQASVKAIQPTSAFAAILAEFPDITRSPGLPRDVKHSTMHYIRTTPGPPVSCRPRRLPPQKAAGRQGRVHRADAHRHRAALCEPLGLAHPHGT